MDSLGNRWLIAALLLISGAVYWVSRSFDHPPELLYKASLSQLRKGDFPAAAEAAHKASQKAVSAAWKSRFQLIEAEARLEAGEIDYFKALVAMPDAVAPVEYQVRSRVLRSRRLIGANKLEEAGELLDQASVIARQNSRIDLQSEILSLAAQKFARSRKLPEAEVTFQQARDVAAQQSDIVREAVAINGLAMLRMLRSRCDEAIPLFELVHAKFEQTGATFGLSAADHNLALCYGNLGDFEKALSLRQSLLNVIPPSTLLANNIGETGTLHLNSQQPQKAIPLYREAVRIARKHGSSSDAARWAGNLTLALAATSQWDEADKALAEARLLGPESRSVVFLNLAEAEIALGRGRFPMARRLAQSVIDSNPENTTAIWQAHADIGKAWAAEGRSQEGDKAFEEAIHVIESSQSVLAGPGYKLTFLARLIQFYQDYVYLLIARGEPEKALRVADGSRAHLLAEAFSSALKQPRQLAVVDFKQTARISNRVWLAYWLAPRRGYLWIVTAKEIRVVPIPGSDAITPLVEQYRGFIETAMRDPMAMESDAGRKLYDALIVPAAWALPKNAAVMIVPDGPLHQLSFDTLPIYAGGKPHYWIEDVNVALAPSFGIFRSAPVAQGVPRPALLLGDPLSPDVAYPPLKFAAKELTGVQKELAARGTKLVTGANARPEVWPTLNPSGFSIIHIAAHAEANRASPLDSALILSPGQGYRLPARDLIDVPVSADLVTLSACRSSGSRIYAGEGFVGLSWAFLHAGARSVIAGLWDVADESTEILMSGLYKGIGEGKTPAVALHNARKAMLSTRYAKPYYWGPFQCYVR